MNQLILYENSKLLLWQVQHALYTKVKLLYAILVSCPDGIWVLANTVLLVKFNRQKVIWNSDFCVVLLHDFYDEIGFSFYMEGVVWHCFDMEY